MAGSDWVVSVVAVVALAGCSTTNITNANCGAGTVLKDGVCVALDDAGVDGTTSDAGDVGADTSAGEVEGAVDAPVADEPCPTGLLSPEQLIDCSGACAKLDPRCEAQACGSSLTPLALPNKAWSDPKIAYRIRTPSRPGRRCKECDAGPVYSMQIDWPSGGSVKALLKPPYRAATLQAGRCNYLNEGTNCVLSNAALFIYTDDPDAPSQNIVVSTYPTKDGGVCP